MTSPDKNFWTYEVYYRAFIFTNLFTETTRDQRFIVSVADLLESLPNLYDTVIPTIPILQRENYLLWKNLPKDNHVDLLLFVFLENYKFKFNIHKLNKYDTINETLLKVIMKDYGWDNMPDTVIDIGKKGYDQLRRRIYIVKDVVKYMSIVQSCALENFKNKEYRRIYNIKKNLDYTRKFPDWGRRFPSTPKV